MPTAFQLAWATRLAERQDFITKQVKKKYATVKNIITFYSDGPLAVLSTQQYVTDILIHLMDDTFRFGQVIQEMNSGALEITFKDDYTEEEQASWVNFVGESLVVEQE